eukprot:m.32752 g.32752  ORF g.32752 m.32752 type:complete len:315 (-) comp12457_c0_seq2:2086-3030(-)
MGFLLGVILVGGKKPRGEVRVFGEVGEDQINIVGLGLAFGEGLAHQSQDSLELRDLERTGDGVTALVGLVDGLELRHQRGAHSRKLGLPSRLVHLRCVALAGSICGLGRDSSVGGFDPSLERRVRDRPGTPGICRRRHTSSLRRAGLLEVLEGQLLALLAAALHCGLQGGDVFQLDRLLPLGLGLRGACRCRRHGCCRPKDGRIGHCTGSSQRERTLGVSSLQLGISRILLTLQRPVDTHVEREPARLSPAFPAVINAEGFLPHWFEHPKEVEHVKPILPTLGVPGPRGVGQHLNRLQVHPNSRNLLLSPQRLE